jgi:hypothetical protein
MRVTCVAALFVPAIALAEAVTSPADVTLRTSPTSLLSDQVQALLPIEMKVEPGPTTTDETRYSLQFEDMKLTMVAYETSASMGSDFRAAVAADLKTQGDNLVGAKLSKLAVKSPLEGYEALPRLPDSTDEAHTLIYAAYVGSPTATVQVLAFYVSPEALPYVHAWIALARRITTSVALGKEPIGVKTWVHPFAGSFIVAIPPGWVERPRVKMGATILPLRAIAPLGQRGASCEMQVGAADTPDPDGGDATIVHGSFSGEAVDWIEWATEDGASMRARVSRGLVTLTCRATRSDELPALRARLRALKIADRRQRAP